MLAFLLGGAGATALLVWHMQRRSPAKVALSFARLLPEPRPAAEAERRFALRLPLGTVEFWLRMTAALLALIAIWGGWTWLATSRGQGVGLRIVLDVTDGMGVASADGIRLSEAVAVARAQLQEAEQGAGDQFCAELIRVGAQPGVLEGLAALRRATPLREGGEIGALLTAVDREARDCPITHVLVLTDRPAPVREATGGPRVIWHQVGEPVANAGLARVLLRRPDLAGAPAELEISVRVDGEMPPPRLVVEGPSGRVEPTLVPSVERDGLLLARVPAGPGGELTASLLGGGAYTGDDRLAVTLPEAERLSLDWRLPEIGRPRGVSEGGELLVAPLEDISPDDEARPLLATYDGWSDPAPREVGTFHEDPAFARVLNLDAFEAEAPRPFAGELPRGFVPILAERGTGHIFVARRANPPGLLVPAPRRGPGRFEALSLTLFFEALADLTNGGRQTLPLQWLGPDGTPIPDAWTETETARPLAASKMEDVAPAPRPGMREPPTVPLIIALLVALCIERGLHLISARRRAAQNGA